MLEQSHDIPPQGQSEVTGEPSQSARLPPSAFTLLITDDASIACQLLRQLPAQVRYILGDTHYVCVHRGGKALP